MPLNNNSLLEEIFKLSRSIREEMSHQDISNLSLLQMQALWFVKKRGTVAMSELAANFSIELPSATSLVDKLVKSELVQRRKDSKDRRIVSITLSTKGAKLCEIAYNQRNKTMGHILSYLSSQDQKDLLRIVAALNRTLENNEK